MTKDVDGKSKDKSSGYTHGKVDAFLGATKLDNEKEKNLARAAWLRAYSGRKTRQAGSITMLTTAIALVTGFVSDASVAPPLAIAGIALVVAVIGYLVAWTWLGRDKEAVEAAAAVLQYRSENT